MPPFNTGIDEVRRAAEGDTKFDGIAGRVDVVCSLKTTSGWGVASKQGEGSDRIGSAQGRRKREPDTRVAP